MPSLLLFGGGSASTPTTVTGARQSTRNSVDVTFSIAPKSFNRAAADDALNPGLWSVAVYDPFTATARMVQHIEEISDTVFRVYTDGALDPDAVYTVEVANTLEDETNTVIDPAQRSANFDTFDTFDPRRPVAAIEGRADIANPQVKSDLPASHATLGTYHINDRGDYANETGDAYLRKRILRRAQTIQGEFVYDPEYGFAEPIKGLITDDKLRRMQARAQAQILNEPDVASVTVTVTRAAGQPGVVYMYFRATKRTGEIVSDTVALNLGGG